MSATAPQGSSMGSLRRGADPLDRMPVRGGAGEGVAADGTGGREDGGRNGDKAREERVAAMDKGERRPAAAPTSVPV